MKIKTVSHLDPNYNYTYPHPAISHNMSTNKFSCLICLEPLYHENPNYEEVLKHVKEHLKKNRRSKTKKESA